MFHLHLLHAALLAGGGLAAYSLFKNASASGGAAPSAGPVTPAVGHPASPSVSGYAVDPTVSGNSAAHAGVQHYHGHDRGFFGSPGHPQVGAAGPGIGPWNNPHAHHVGVNRYRMPPHVGWTAGAGFGHPNPHARGFIGRV
jgi:hypothetical protein